MMRDLGSFGHNHSRNRQPRRLVVPVPGAKAADHRCNKNPDHQKKHNRDQEFQDSKYKTKSHLVTSINEFPLGQGFINSRIRELGAT